MAEAGANQFGEWPVRQCEDPLLVNDISGDKGQVYMSPEREGKRIVDDLDSRGTRKDIGLLPLDDLLPAKVDNIELFLREQIKDSCQATLNDDIVIANNPDILSSRFGEALPDVAIGSYIRLIADAAKGQSLFAIPFEGSLCRVGRCVI
jgi:hypothetical protein